MIRDDIGLVYHAGPGGAWRHQVDATLGADIGGFGKKLKKLGKKTAKLVAKPIRMTMKAPLAGHKWALKRMGKTGRKIRRGLDQAEDTVTMAVPQVADSMGIPLTHEVMNFIRPQNPEPAGPGNDAPLPTIEEPNNTLPWILAAGAGLGLLFLLKR